MKSNYAELQRRSAINYGDTECKYKLYVDYAREETIATETVIEDLEIEQYRNIISSIFLIIVMALFVSGLIVVYTRMQPWLDTTMLI